MSLLTATNLGQSFGAVDIFSGISVALPPGAKVGLVGPNGVGKTTLLLILAGLMSPSSGVVHRAKSARIGYLPQESADAFVGRDHSVYDEMLMLFADLRAQEDRLREMERAMAAEGDTEDQLAQYGAALERFELAGGYQYELRIRQTLSGLGFDAASRELSLAHLSGGQKTRALLARLLLEEPDLLVLDEPTNHLDVAALEWLEGALAAWPGAVLIVSHDRYFLDRVVTRIWEMSPAHIEIYRGNYSEYVQQRQDRWERRGKEFAAFRERMEKELDYVRRNIAGQRTQQAQGKLKRLTRELKAVHAGGLAAIQGKNWSQVADALDLSGTEWGVAEATEALRALRPPNHRPPQLNLRLADTHRSGDLVLRAGDLRIGYPGNPLFDAEDFELRRLECAALIGPNGTGKTTFLRTVLGLHEPLQGSIQLGASLKMGYFAQAHETLDPMQTVLDEFLRHHAMNLSEARSVLGRYLFRGDDVYKRVSALSGGERGRLALAILALQGANFLLLDEPTNHLDIPAQEELQAVLETFDGTILMVSHDRYLVDRLATQIWLLADGRLHVFKGTYREYLAARAGVAAAETDSSRPATVADRDVSAQSSQARSKNEQRRLEAALAKLEQQIERHEGRLAELGEALQEATAGQDVDRIQSLSLEYADLEAEVEKLMASWEKLAHER